MNVAHRIWVQSLQTVRPLIYGCSSELLQYGVKNYNSPNISSALTHESHLCHSNFSNDRLCVSQHVSRTSKGSYVKVLTKNFMHESFVYYREFKDGENTYAHDVLLSLPEYNSTTVNRNDLNLSMQSVSFNLPDKDWYTSDLEEIVQTVLYILRLSDACSFIDDSKCFSLFSSLRQRVNELSDEQIIQILSTLIILPVTYNPSNLAMLKSSLNENCSNRIKRWSTSLAFLIADYWYLLGTPHLSAYYCKLTHELAKRYSSMSPSELVQYMFCVNLNRNMGPVKLGLLENRILDIFETLSIEEAGIIAMGFFKAETSIYSGKLLDAFIKKTTDNIENISSLTLSAILKILRKSLSTMAVSKCRDLLDAIYPHINKFESLALLHLALLGTNLLVFHENTINYIAQRFGNEMASLRLKDIERLTYTLMLYRYVPTLCPNFFDLVINELRKPERVVEINQFPSSFISCVNYLAAFGIFPYDLISACVQPTMIELLKQSHLYKNIGRDLNELNWTLNIEVPPSYPGYRLNPALSQELTKKFLGRIPCKTTKNLTHQEHFTLDVIEKLSSLIGQSVHPIFILPHFSNSDLVFCTNKDGEPVPIPEEYFKIPIEQLKLPLPYPNLNWNAVIIGGRNSFIRYSYNLRGNFEMKKRQLNLLGYNVSVVPYQDYLKKTVKNKVSCLENILALNFRMNLKRDQSQLDINTDI